jgi:processive 1,2-diacylglycerol beta-glucosyltransferase
MKILVIHATAGAGHKKAAEAVFNGLRAKGGIDARLVDALDYTNPFFKITYPWFYGFLVTRMPWAWGLLFGLLDIPWMQSLVRIVRRLYNGFNARALQEFLVQEQFDAVITTQFLSAEVCAYLKREGKITSKIICVVTDFDVHHIWVNAGIDVYSAACEYTRNKLIALGVSPAVVFVTGIPTDAKFSAHPDIKAIKNKLGLHDGMTILIATGSFGMGPVEELMKLLGEHQLLIVCGHNQALFERLKPLAAKDTHVLGLVDNMDELMSVSDIMVTKPGGLSIAEALVKRLPMIFFSAIPGQETNNIKVLSAYKVVSPTQSSLPQIAEIIHAWDADPKSLDALRRRMEELSKPKAVADIISLL